MKQGRLCQLQYRFQKISIKGFYREPRWDEYNLQMWKPFTGWSESLRLQSQDRILGDYYEFGTGDPDWHNEVQTVKEEVMRTMGYERDEIGETWRWEKWNDA